jgi:hypothetical protein
MLAHDNKSSNRNQEESSVRRLMLQESQEVSLRDKEELAMSHTLSISRDQGKCAMIEAVPDPRVSA